MNKSKQALLAQYNAEQLKLKKEIREQSEALGPQRLNNLYQIAQQAKKKDFFRNVNFYLVLVLTNEKNPEKKAEDNVFVRRSCPTPGYNQNTFKYHYQSDSLEYLWTIPPQDMYWHVYNHSAHYLQDKKTKQMAAFVCMMESGQLLDWVKKENGELPDAVITINNPEVTA